MPRKILEEDKIYYINSIRVTEQEIAEDNQIFIKGETWQWGLIEAGDIHIHSSIHVFNIPGNFGTMTPKPASNDRVDFELSEIKTANPDTDFNINISKNDLDVTTLKCTFEEIIGSNFMIVDHFLFSQKYGDNIDGILGAKNPWSGELADINMKLWQGLEWDGCSREELKTRPKEFKYFGDSPIAHRPAYKHLNFMERKILRGELDGQKIFRWYGRTEGWVGGIKYKFGKKIVFYQYINPKSSHWSSFNDYEISIIQ